MAYERKEIILTKDDETIIFQTLDEAGVHIGVTRERVRQLANKAARNLNLHKKSGYKINYGKLILNDVEKQDLRLKTALNQGFYEYEGKMFKHYKESYFIASDSSYIYFRSGTYNIIYTAPKFGTRPCIGQERIYRIVAGLYLTNPENKPFIDHIKGLTHGHGIDNIRWATHLENMKGHREISTAKRSQYRIVGTERLFNTQQELADFIGCEQTQVSMALNSRHSMKTAKGYKLERVFTDEQLEALQREIVKLNELYKLHRK